jgi:tetratricopeptide (TPR) repeat protein
MGYAAKWGSRRSFPSEQSASRGLRRRTAIILDRAIVWAQARVKRWWGKMMSDTLLSAIGASLASFALVLLMMRLLSWRGPRSVVALTLRWSRAPVHRVATLTAVLLAVSALCFAKIADNADALATSAATENIALENASASCNSDQQDLADPRQQAYERFREYANGLRAKMQGLTDTANSLPPAGDANLPDVDTMIGRLVKRLETDSGNADGWRMLGWSYLHTGKYAEAVSAYSTALALDPKNADTMKALEEARATAKNGEAKQPEMADARDLTKAASPQAADPMAMGKEMTERLAGRLEVSPRDPDGWLRLMRARTVLGQQDLAKAALKKALTVFADDKPSRDQISAAAKDMGIGEN